MITEKVLTLVAIICNGLEQPCGLWMPIPKPISKPHLHCTGALSLEARSQLSNQE